MKKLLEYAEARDTVVVWRVDRLGRSLVDGLNAVNLLRERGVNVQSNSDGNDPATSAGRMMLNFLASLAEYERELIVERVNAGISAGLQSGTRFGRPLSDPTVIADKLAIAKDARAKGRTAEDAARLLGWSRATLYRHLNPNARSAESQRSLITLRSTDDSGTRRTAARDHDHTLSANRCAAGPQGRIYGITDRL